MTTTMRSRAGAAAGIVAAVIGAALFFYFSEARERGPDLPDMKGELRELVEQAKKRIERGEDLYEVSNATREAVMKRLAGAASKMSGKRGRAMGVVMSALGQLNDATTAYDVARKKLEGAGGTDPKTLSSAKVAEERLRLAQAVQQRSVEYERIARGIPDEIKAGLERTGDTASSRGFMAGFMGRGGEKYAALTELAASQVEEATAAAGMLSFFQERWGDWRLQGDEVTVVPKHRPRFLELQQRLRTAVERQEKAEVRMQELQQQMLAAPRATAP